MSNAHPNRITTSFYQDLTKIRNLMKFYAEVIIKKVQKFVPQIYKQKLFVKIVRLCSLAHIKLYKSIKKWK